MGVPRRHPTWVSREAWSPAKPLSGTASALLGVCGRLGGSGEWVSSELRSGCPASCVRRAARREGESGDGRRVLPTMAELGEVAAGPSGPPSGGPLRPPGRARSPGAGESGSGCPGRSAVIAPGTPGVRPPRRVGLLRPSATVAERAAAAPRRPCLRGDHAGRRRGRPARPRGPRRRARAQGQTVTSAKAARATRA